MTSARPSAKISPSAHGIGYNENSRLQRHPQPCSPKSDGDIFVCGHTHKPYRKDLDGRVFINAASVGKPKDGNPRACLAVIGIETDPVRVEFRRVPYDAERTAAAIVEQGLPEYYA